MADSQVAFPYDDAVFNALDPILSTDRFGRYMRLARGIRQDAYLLYLYNARLSKSLLFPIHLAEVSLRNAIDRLFCEDFGEDWPTEVGFLSILSVESRETLNRAKAIVLRKKGAAAPRGQLVSTLMFDFWSNLFRPEYDRPLWQTNLPRIVQCATVVPTRAEMQVLVRKINGLRNRIAHHEPIIDMNVTALHESLLDLIGMIDATAARWVLHYSTVGATIRTRPGPGGTAEPTFGLRCDPRFQIVGDDDELSAVMASYRETYPAIISRDAAGTLTGVVLASDILRFLQDRSVEAGSLVELSAHTIRDVLDALPATSWRLADVSTPMSVVVAMLQEKGVRVVVATGTGDAAMPWKGFVLRAHRRY